MARSLISNERFRERYEELAEKEDLTLAEVAYRCGWIAKSDTKEKPDSSRVARTLGLVQEQGAFRSHMSYDNAVLMCRALHIDYYEVGV